MRLVGGSAMLPPMTASPPAVKEAESAGLDMSLSDESLRLSYDQRALQHQEALNLALELERAGRKLRERPESPDSAAVTLVLSIY